MIQSVHFLNLWNLFNQFLMLIFTLNVTMMYFILMNFLITIIKYTLYKDFYLSLLAIGEDKWFSSTPYS